MVGQIRTSIKIGGYSVTKEEELILKTTKEIIVKFIEIGKVYPSSFEQNYQLVNQVVRNSIKSDNEGGD